MNKSAKNIDLAIAENRLAKLASEVANSNRKMAERAEKLIIANRAKAKREAELIVKKVDKAERAAELVFTNAEKAKRRAELVIANAEEAGRAARLVIKNLEKANRDDQLIIGDQEITFQNEEKAKRAAELVIAEIQITKRKAELVIANIEKAKQVAKLIIAEKELSFQEHEKSERTTELVVADAEKAKHEAELVIANIKKAKYSAELVIANIEKAKRSAEQVIAEKDLVYQKSESAKCKAELIIAKVEKAKRSAELIVANIEKAKLAAECVFVSRELVLSQEKEKLINELSTANKELSNEIEKRIVSDNALKVSNEKFSKAFLSSPYSLSLTTVSEGKLIEVNDSFTNIFGYTREEALSNSTIGLNIWENIEDRNSLISSLLGGDVVSRKEYLFRKKSGIIRTGSISANLININNVDFIISCVDDITEQKRATKLLEESEKKSTSIMENSADAIFIVNEKAQYIYTNKEASTMLGYTSEEMKSKTIRDLIEPNKHEEIFEIFNQVFNEGKSYTEIELLKKDGDYISTDLNAVLLPDGNIFGSCRDITERKKSELELIKTKEQAEESNRLKSAFLANMSHEIRTPMNGILGFTQLLKNPNLSNEKIQDYIQTIQISGARMLNTINSIVDMSKIESGLIEIESRETDINKNMEFIYKFFKPDAAIKGLQLKYSTGLSDKEAIIITDNGKVNGILNNLVRNSIKFTVEGSIEFGYEKKGEYLEFFVKDTGIGIPDNQKEIIFERFRQGSESYNRNYEGNGLGLSISESYAKMLGGNIWMESEEGNGAIFYFTIPYNQILKEQIEKTDTKTDESKEVLLKGLKILIAEDDEISYSLLLSLVHNISKEVLWSKTGVEAVEACRKNPDLDLLLMDIKMPDMDGNEATRQIRQFNKDVIIIAQSANAFTGERQKGLEAGCNEWISKPIDSKLLMDLILKYHNNLALDDKD